MKFIYNKINFIFTFIFLYLIIIFLIIDKKILYLIFLLIFNNNLFVFLKIGYEMEFNKYLSYIFIFMFRIFLLIYIIFLPIINLVYIIFTGHKYNYPLLKQYLKISNNPLLIPHFECSWLNGINVAYNDIDLFNKLQNKIYWNNLFIKNNVNTPKIIGTIINKNININKLLYNKNNNYIIKPIIGGLGRYIFNYNEENILNIDNNNYIIQEKIIQTDIKGHFRINTIYNKKNNKYDFSNIYLCLNKKNKIASNNHNNGKCHEVDITKNIIRDMKNDNNYIFDNNFSVDIIKNIINDAIKLHKNLPNFVITIGWDIMIEKDKYYFLEGNIPHGTVFKDDKYFYEKSLKINNLIYNSIF